MHWATAGGVPGQGTCWIVVDDSAHANEDTALLQFVIFHMIRTFKANDTGAEIVRKNNQVIIAPQPLVRGREAESTLLPVELELLE